MLEFITDNFWFIVPLYATAFLLFFGVFAIKIISGRIILLKHLLTPIDFNLTFFDKRRIIGDHKPIAGWIIPSIAAIGSYFVFNDLFLMLVISYFAFFGDLVGSFLKCRMAIADNKPLLIIDQLSFILVAYAGTFFFEVRIPLTDLFLLLVLTFLLHFLGNVVLFKLKLKSRPY